VIDKLLRILIDAEPGNHTNTLYITQTEYDEIKTEFRYSFNSIAGPFGIVWIKIK
jgi:hypothetical protein